MLGAILSCIGGTIITVLLIVGVIWLCAKYPDVKVFILTTFLVIMAGVSAFCGYQINTYYAARGGVLGYISSRFEFNRVEFVNQTDIELSNIELVAVGVDNIYSAKLTKDTRFEIKAGSKYLIEINGLPCKYVMNGDDGATVQFTYKFNTETTSITDTLEIIVVLGNNGTTVVLRTYGGSKIVGLWHEFFNRKGFTIHIAQVDNVYLPNNSASANNLQADLIQD